MIELNKIYNEDCLDGMKLIDSESIDFILSDYPFNIQDNKWKKEQYAEFVEATILEFKRIIKPDGNLLIINNPTNIYNTTRFYNNAGFIIRNGIALIRKGALRPAWMYGFQHNYALIMSLNDNKKLKWNGPKKNHDKTFSTDVIHYQNGYRGKGKAWHPQAISLDLTKHFIETLSNPNDLVFDPFMGSGSTAVAAKMTGRNFIGFEFNPLYCEMGNNRLALI